MPQEILDKFGIKSTEILFTSRKKGILRYDNGNEDTLENISSISIDQAPGVTSISVTDNTKEGKRSVGTAVGNIKEIIIVE